LYTEVFIQRYRLAVYKGRKREKPPLSLRYREVSSLIIHKEGRFCEKLPVTPTIREVSSLFIKIIRSAGHLPHLHTIIPMTVNTSR
jgi:hypothetical protein